MLKIAKHEKANVWTHFAGALFAMTSVWMVLPASELSWKWGMSIAVYVAGMFLMFASSTIYHWATKKEVKQFLRKIDHTNIYVMIAGSYSPICLGVVGGYLGWIVFFLLWFVAIAGAVYKFLAIGRYPRLSLALYLLMGWSGVLLAKPVWEGLSWLELSLILAEGLMYTIGTYFYSHDDNRNHFHAIWHIFVLLGALAHWGAVLSILVSNL